METAKARIYFCLIRL